MEDRVFLGKEKAGTLRIISSRCMRFPGSPRAVVNFPAERLGVIADHEEHHFWHDPRRRLLLRTIAGAHPAGTGPLLDVGCGTGSLVTALLRQGYDAKGIDPWAHARKLPAASFQPGTVCDLPWPDETFASVCAFDVLEHVDEPSALIAMRRVHRPGGALFVSVPAHAILWSPRDDRAGHLRRYSRASLRRALADAGYQVERIFGFQFLLLPALIASRLLAKGLGTTAQIDREDGPSPPMNAVLRGINLAEVSLGRLLRPPTGSSLIAVSRKRQ